MELGKVIAANVSRLRAERGLSMGDLSKASGVSKAMLSDMERGSSNPSINTIWKVANALNVPYTAIMEAPDDEASLVRAAEAVVQEGETDAYHVWCYFPTTPRRNFEFWRMELAPHASNTSGGHSPHAQEYVCVEKGNLRIQTSSGMYDLEPGDALTFASSTAHTYINDGDEPACAVIINYYPAS